MNSCRSSIPPRRAFARCHLRKAVCAYLLGWDSDRSLETVYRAFCYRTMQCFTIWKLALSARRSCGGKDAQEHVRLMRYMLAAKTALDLSLDSSSLPCPTPPHCGAIPDLETCAQLAVVHRLRLTGSSMNATIGQGYECCRDHCHQRDTYPTHNRDRFGIR